jgi:large subunit ribosomal protein L3
MVKGLLGRKLGMARIFTEDGRWIPVTMLEAGPCVVVQRKTADNDGYDAIQVGFGDRKEKRTPKPQQGHFAKAGTTPKRHLREFRVAAEAELQPGDEVKADIFEVGDFVDISGTSKGKGFQGVIKRHGFHGGPAGHGSMFHREPGSIGQAADPAKVFKGIKLPGQMGNRRITTQNLEVVQVDPDKNVLCVRGAVPGAKGGLVEIRMSAKKTKEVK